MQKLYYNKILSFFFGRKSWQNQQIKKTDLADDQSVKISATNQNGHFGLQSNGFHKF